MRWEKVQVHGRQGQGGIAYQQQQQEEVGEISGPGKRWGHTCNAVKEGRFLYVFGGYGKDNCQTNQIHVFDTGGSSTKKMNFILFYFFAFFILFLRV